MTFPEEKLEALKKEYIDLLISTGRKGIKELIEYLETRTDFFTAPASTKFHNNFEGGLLEHSLNVYENFQIMLDAKGVQMDEDSIIICALLHDLCKCNFYVKEDRNRKVDGKWQTYESMVKYEKSVYSPAPLITLHKDYQKLCFTKIP